MDIKSVRKRRPYTRPPYTKAGLMITESLRKRGISRIKLAKLIDVNSSTLTANIFGRTPSKETFKKLEKWMGISLRLEDFRPD